MGNEIVAIKVHSPVGCIDMRLGLGCLADLYRFGCFVHTTKSTIFPLYIDRPIVFALGYIGIALVLAAVYYRFIQPK